MKAFEIIELIDSSYHNINKISDGITKDIDYEHLDIVYLKGKLRQFSNLVKHVEEQLKHKSNAKNTN